MRVTLVSFFKKTVPGHIFRGKKRLVRPVTKTGMDNLIQQYAQEERNMMFLRHPYLTTEESKGHAKQLNKHDSFLKKWQDERVKNLMRPHVTLEQRLCHLRVKEGWE